MKISFQYMTTETLAMIKLWVTTFNQTQQCISEFQLCNNIYWFPHHLCQKPQRIGLQPKLLDSLSPFTRLCCCYWHSLWYQTLPRYSFSSESITFSAFYIISQMEITIKILGSINHHSSHLSIEDPCSTGQLASRVEAGSKRNSKFDLWKSYFYTNWYRSNWMFYLPKIVE